MSRSAAPAPAGTPVHSTKVRIIGAEVGTDAYQAVLDQHHGVITQFLNAQHQRAQLSGLSQHKASIDTGQVTMMYHNNQGQDTLTVEVRTSGGEEKSEQSSGGYWKWAIVETVIPDIQGLTSFAMSAFMTPPPSNGQFGVALDHVTPFDLDKPPLCYPVDGADLGIFMGDVQNNDGVSSLLVDLRPFPGGVKFDLYGYINRYQDGTKSGPNTTAHYLAYRGKNAITAYTGNLIAHDGIHSAGPWPAPGDLSTSESNLQYRNVGTPHTTIANVELDWPETSAFTFQAVSSLPASFGSFTGAGGFTPQGPQYGGMSVTWTPGNMPTLSSFNVSGLIGAAGGLFSETTTFGADGLIKKVRGLGAMDSYANASTSFNPVALFGAGPTDSQGNYGFDFFDYTLYWIGDHPQVANYVYPSRDCPVSFIVLDDRPDALSNHFGSPLMENSYEWELSKKFPDRWKLKQLNTVHIPAIDPPVGPSTIADHFNMIKLGTVIINPKKGKGGIKFIAA